MAASTASISVSRDRPDRPRAGTTLPDPGRDATGGGRGTARQAPPRRGAPRGMPPATRSGSRDCHRRASPPPGCRTPAARSPTVTGARARGSGRRPRRRPDQGEDVGLGRQERHGETGGQLPQLGLVTRRVDRIGPERGRPHHPQVASGPGHSLRGESPHQDVDSFLPSDPARVEDHEGVVGDTEPPSGLPRWSAPPGTSAREVDPGEHHAGPLGAEPRRLPARRVSRDTDTVRSTRRRHARSQRGTTVGGGRHRWNTTGAPVSVRSATA